MRKRKKRSREEWTKLVAEWRGGALSQKAFSKRKGIAATTLSWWICRLGREARERAALVPVEVVADAPAGAADFRVELAGGRTLFVPATFDESALRRLLAVVDGVAC
jgi:hypothetical protein